MSHHSPVACQRDPTSRLHTRKSDSTVSCRSSAACQHTRKSASTVSCRSSAAGCRIKQEQTMLCHSPVLYQRDPTSKLHTRKSDLTVSYRSSAACQHTRRSVLTVSCRTSAAACKIKKTLGHSLVACQRDPASELHTKKSDWTVSRHKSTACQHTRRSVLTVSCRGSAADCRIKQEIKSSLLPKSKPTSIPTRRRHSHRSSSVSSAALEVSPSQHHWNQNSSLK
jgi:hypothetical protein